MKQNMKKMILSVLFLSMFVFVVGLAAPAYANEADTVDTYKMINYTLGETEGTFFFENEENAFTVSGKLYAALKGSSETMEAIDAANGIPVWGTESFLITTKKVFTLDTTDENAEVVVTDGIGHIEGKDTVLGVDYEPNKALILDSFADAYLFAYDRGGHDLGAPVGLATLLEDEGEAALVQAFEHGEIVMFNFQRPAVPIYGAMLTAWKTPVADGGLGLLSEDGIGAPLSRQFEVNGTVYQNFQYGWAEITDGDVDFTYDQDLGVDYNGKTVNRFVGYFENRANVSIGHPDFGHELLRTHESYMRAYSEVTASGFILYRGGIREGHEWNANGLTQGFPAGDSTATPWGQSSFSVIIMRSPFAEAQVVRNSILDQYSTKGNDQPGNLGFPTTKDYTLTVTVEHEGESHDLQVTFQNFEGGYIRSYVVGFNVITEEFAGFYVDETGVAFNLETDAEASHPYDLSGLDEDTTNPGDDDDDDDNNNNNDNDNDDEDKDKETSSDSTLVIILSIVGGLVVIGGGLALWFLVFKKK